MNIGRHLKSELSVTDSVPWNNALLTLPGSSIAQTQSKIIAQELQDSNVDELSKTSADDTRETLFVEGTTEIYDYDISHDEVKATVTKVQGTETAPADPPNSLAPVVYKKTKDGVMCSPMENKSIAEAAGERRKSKDFSKPDEDKSAEKIRGVETDDEYVDLLSASILDTDARFVDSAGCVESGILTPCDASSSLSANGSQVACQLPDMELNRNDSGRRNCVFVESSDKSALGNFIGDELSETVACVERNDTDIVSEVGKDPGDGNVDVRKNSECLVVDADDRISAADTRGGRFITESDVGCKQNFISVSADCFDRHVTDDVRSTADDVDVSKDSSTGADFGKADRKADAELPPCQTEIIIGVGDSVGAEQPAEESMTFEVMSTVGLLPSSLADASDTDSFDDCDSDGTISLNLDGVEGGIPCDYFSGSLAFAQNKRLSSCAISCLQNVLIPIGSAEDVDSKDGRIARDEVFCLRDYHRLDHRVLRKNGRLKPSPPRSRKGKILTETEGIVGDAFLAKEPIDESFGLATKASDDVLETNEISDSCKANSLTYNIVERSHLQTSERIKPFQLSSNCCVNSVEDR